MTQTPLLITADDRTRLWRMLGALRPYAYGNRSALDELEGDLLRARIVPPGAVPSIVVTMNSTVRVRDLALDADETFRIVYPAYADPAAGRISVLSPLGAAVLGSRAGEVVEQPGPDGPRQILIQEVIYQPERRGEFSL